MHCLPIEIESDEKVVRAIGSHHLKRDGSLKYQAFMPPSDDTTVSVIRQLMGNDFCKDKAVCILDNRYRGLAVVPAGTVRALGLDVLDDRVEYYGHANIDYGSPPPPPNDPLCATERQIAVAKYCQIANASRYVEDSKPASKGWHDNPL